MDNLPTDWKKFHADNLAKVDPQLVADAVTMLRNELVESLPQIRAKMAEDPQTWWTPYHFYWGMAVRNLLRKRGFTDDRFGGNLDDFYLGLVEKAAEDV